MKYLKYLIFGFIVLGLCIRATNHRGALFTDWDEGIYAEVADEMIQNGSYIYTTFNGEPWLDKPPVAGMLNAITFTLFPQHKELASRLLMVVMASCLLGILYLLARRTTNYFFSSAMSSIAEWQRELIYFSPIFATALTPVFLDRAIRLNTDSILALSWLGYFLVRESFVGKLGFIALGTWTKSIVGFYPMLFDIFTFSTAKQKSGRLFQYGLIIVVGLGWPILSYFRYGQYFIKAHIEDQLIKRVTVPIELHFGGRLFYPEFLWKELSFVLIIIVLAYVVIAWDIRKKILTQQGNNFLQKLLYFFRSIELSHYLLLCAGIPFFALLTFAKSKIWWYALLVLPFFSLTIPYLFMRISHVAVRNMLLMSIMVFFLYRFFPVTYGLKPITDVPEKLRVAQCVALLPGSDVLFMVNDQERRNRNVVEAAQLQTSSSFTYGGSPAFVFYVNKRVDYFYRADELLKRLYISGAVDNSDAILVISREDLAREEFREIRQEVEAFTRETTCFFGEWEVFMLKSDDYY